MAKLLIVVEVPEDPTLVDPHDIADDIVAAHNVGIEHTPGGGPRINFVSAEWEVQV